MQPQDPCRKEGCTRPRTRLSVFCEEHHVEQLIRAGLRPAVLPIHDPRADLVKRCRHPLGHYEQGVITADELLALLASALVHGGRCGESEYWPDCFDALPPGLIETLLAYLRRAKRPFGYCLDTPEKVDAARAVQTRLISEMDAWVGRNRESNPR